jgi:hypothetical protein
MAASRSDLPDGGSWRDYCDAALRKIDIAGYHLERLRAQASEGRLEPTIPVQAHLEGILFAFVAAADQVAEAINLGMKLNRGNPTLQEALEAIPRSPIRSRLFRWHQAPIAADVRDLRRRAIHHHYAKNPSGPTLVVQEPTGARPYGGSRDLVSYGEAAVTHVRQLREELDGLKDCLSSSSPQRLRVQGSLLRERHESGLDRPAAGRTSGMPR